jgi:hypothetical protein
VKTFRFCVVVCVLVLPDGLLPATLRRSVLVAVLRVCTSRGLVLRWFLTLALANSVG